MATWQKILYAILLIVLAFFVFRTLKSNPHWFSKANFSKSAFTLGILALGLIIFIGLLVLMLRY